MFRKTEAHLNFGTKLRQKVPDYQITFSLLRTHY